MRVREAARLLKISADWLRELEKRGKIPPVTRDMNGCRRYSDEDIIRLRRILYPDQRPLEDPEEAPWPNSDEFI